MERVDGFLRTPWWSRCALTRVVASSAAILGVMISFASSKWRGRNIVASSSFISDQLGPSTPAGDAYCEEVWDIDAGTLAHVNCPNDSRIRKSYSGRSRAHVAVSTVYLARFGLFGYWSSAFSVVHGSWVTASSYSHYGVENIVR